MVLTPKTYVLGSSLVVTSPRQWEKAYDINDGNKIEIFTFRYEEMTIKKISKYITSKGC
jgi:hypothetical protein